MAGRGPAAAQANELFTEHVTVDDWFKVWLVEIAAPSASLLANYQSNLRLRTSPELGHLLSRVKELAGFGRRVVHVLIFTAVYSRRDARPLPSDADLLSRLSDERRGPDRRRGQDRGPSQGHGDPPG
jgi:hypothetical protein